MFQYFTPQQNLARKHFCLNHWVQFFLLYNFDKSIFRYVRIRQYKLPHVPVIRLNSWINYDKKNIIEAPHPFMLFNITFYPCKQQLGST